jgi:hypothetical protein
MSIRSLIRLVAAAVTSGVALTAIALPAAANCDWYAKTALKQQQENELKKCGFTGPSWTPDLQAHVKWCATTSPDLWKAEAAKREQMLTQNCKK